MRSGLRPFIALVAWLAPGSRAASSSAEWDAELATDPLMARALGAVSRRAGFSSPAWSLDMLSSGRSLFAAPAGAPAGLHGAGVVHPRHRHRRATSVFSALNAILLRPLPYPGPSRLVAVWENDRMNHEAALPGRTGQLDDWRTGTRTFQHLAAYVDGGGRHVVGRRRPLPCRRSRRQHELLRRDGRAAAARSHLHTRRCDAAQSSRPDSELRYLAEPLRIRPEGDRPVHPVQ